MKNEEIILQESLKLKEQGILKGIGAFIKVKNDDGETQEIELP